MASSTGSRISLSSEEVNVLVYRYLLESGMEHTAFTFHSEASMGRSAYTNAEMAPGALVTYLQKGLLYLFIETHVGPEGLHVNCEEPFSLLRPHDHLHPEDEVPSLSYEEMVDSKRRRMDDGQPQQGSPSEMIIDSRDEPSSSPPISSPQESPRGLEVGLDSEIVSLSWRPGTPPTLAAISRSGTVYLQKRGMIALSPVLVSCPDAHVCWSQDGRFLFAGGMGGWGIWNDQGECSATGPERVNAPSWSSTKLAMVVDGNIKVWEAELGLRGGVGICAGGVECMEISWLGEDHVVAACSDGKVVHVSVETFSIISGIDLTDLSPLWCCKIWNDLVVVGGQGGLVVLKNMEISFNIDSLSDLVTALVFSPNGRFLASGCADGQVRIWEVFSGGRLSEISSFENKSEVANIYWVSDQVIFCSLQSSAKAWNIKGQLLLSNLGTTHQQLTHLAVTVGQVNEVLISAGIGNTNKFLVNNLELQLSE